MVWYINIVVTDTNRAEKERLLFFNIEFQYFFHL